MRTGLFGGSFNPIHNGHIRLAQSVSEKLGLDRVIFIPSGKAPHKSSAEYACAEDRLNMCCLVAEDMDNFEVSDFEVRREGKSYSIYTVRHFHEIFPDDELFLMVGSDMLLSFHEWREYKEILKNVTLTAVTRSGDDLDKLAQKKQELSEYGNIIIAESDPIVISSTILRKMIKNNEDTSCYLNEKVVKYIMMRGLYRNDAD